MNKDIQGFRLSPQQRRAWSLASSDASSNAMSGRATATAIIDGALDVARLDQAIATVVARHEILRTAFHRLPGMQFPLQVIADAYRPMLVTMAVGDADAWSAGMVAGEAPSFTASVRMIGAHKHELVVSASTLAADAAGLERAIAAVIEVYAGATGDDEVLQYAVVSDWLNETIESEDSEAGVRFWHGQLTEPSAAAALTSVPTAKLGRVSTTIDAATTRAIDACATRLGASPAAVMTAAWQVLAFRLYGERAMPIAARLDGRSTDELAGVIGPLARHVPVTAMIDGGSTFAHVVARVEAALAEAAAWQECYDADAVLGGSEPRYLPYAVEYRTGRATVEAGDLVVRTIDSAAQLERFAVLQSFVRGADTIAAELQYDPAQCSADEAARIAARMAVVIASALADVHTAVGRLAILPAAERQTVLVELNATAAAFAAPHVVHQLFEAQVANTPLNVAVVSGDRTLTYRQLDARANQVARRLIARGVGRNVPVGLLMDRSIDMVVGMLGILKAGAAYIPLDAEYPAERLAYMIDNAQAPAIITLSRLTGSLSSPPATVLCLDTDWDDIATEDTTAPGVAVEAEDLAYVLYTSGSTGKPKGVMIPHRALANHMHWMQQRFPLGETDSVLQKTPFSFDASVWEFYAPLLAGGRLVMAQPGGHRDAEYLCETIRQQQITTIQLVPTLLRMMLDQPAFATCTSLARVYCGGEALPIDLRDRFFKQTRDTSGGELINLYGPTETCIDATYHACVATDPVMPIGRPVANNVIYVLDEHRQPVPRGAAGELYIAGAGVGLGYLHNPALTAERFVDDPFLTAGLMYRTGDLGRYLADGSLEYLGRIDNQIKLRGHRIELGEIEATLARHAEVQVCVVVVREDQPGDRRLAAYFVARDGAAPRASDLRAFVKDQLPEYMVPSAITKIAALPLLPNGKVDQRALPMPDDNQAELADAFVAPRNALESQVAQIWSEVLNVSRVGIHDDFFAIGGHSLIATQLTSRIRKLFHVDLPLRELFAAPTVLGLSERIARLQGELGKQAEVADMLAELEGLSDEEVRAILEEPAAAN
ncbi:MAG TPA: amino acid adenylation domain-containing protein [Kofleriaceae bacterium]|jgi:amino acid adenylation domain-containing protein|nr:amino acid adenylation domain-containing protein [Kofleriaceae bacterium]